jgi:quercetin dioxygenase-like cupin family protein
MAADSPMELLSRRRVMGEQAMISHVTLAKGCSVPSHSHRNEQFCCVLSGRLRFGIGWEKTEGYREVDVGAGEVLHLPADVPHSAVALEETVVLDIFSPPSATTGVDRGEG